MDPSLHTNHTALFYASKEEYFNVTVPYFKAGLENNEFCLWVIPENITAKEAETYLRKLVQDVDSCFEEEQLLIKRHKEIYLDDGLFVAHKKIEAFIELEAKVIQNGFAGIRVAGDGSWALANDWFSFIIYEQRVNDIINQYQITALCTYAIEKLDVKKIHEIGSSHQSSIVHRMGRLDRLSPSQFKQPYFKT